MGASTGSGALPHQPKLHNTKRGRADSIPAKTIGRKYGTMGFVQQTSRVREREHAHSHSLSQAIHSPRPIGLHRDLCLIAEDGNSSKTSMEWPTGRVPRSMHGRSAAAFPKLPCSHWLLRHRAWGRALGIRDRSRVAGSIAFRYFDP